MDEATARTLRRELAAALKRQRLVAQMSTNDLAAKPGVGSQAKVSRTENGRTRPDVATVKAWGRATKADSAEIDRLAAIAEELTSISRPWRLGFAEGMVAAQRRIAAYEADATSIQSFAGAVLPGLLQVPAYAHALLSMLPGVRTRELDAAVATRMERQAVLYNPDKPATFVIGDFALRWLPVSPAADLWPRQVERILMLSGLPGVEVLVLPDRPEWLTLPGDAITLYNIPTAPLVLVEDGMGEREERDLETYSRYAALFGRIRSNALAGHAAEERILGSLA